MKLVTVFFDVEGKWGAPFKKVIETPETVSCILDILDRFGIKASFNTCGVLAQRCPDLIKELHNSGHEISSHGFKHENFSALRPYEIDYVLSLTEKAIQAITKEPVIGIRAPFSFCSKTLYRLIGNRGYRWASNRWAVREEQLYPPHGCKLNPRHVAAGLFCKARWLTYTKHIYKKDRILELPQMSTNDCGLLELTNPIQDSSEPFIRFALNALKDQFKASKTYFNLNFHEWLIGSGNRLNLLERILAHLSESDTRFVLPKQLVTVYGACGASTSSSRLSGVAWQRFQ